MDRRSGLDGKARDSASPAASRQPTIVGVGASAGGLEAVTALLRALPAESGLAVVFVQHLSPDHDSVLAQLLGNAAAMPVAQAADGQPLEADRVYVIPPAVEMTVDRGRLRLTPRHEHDTVFLPVDRFFHSLASYAGERAVGVVLSGTASDGAAGLRAIAAAGGIALAQDPEEARYDGMPRASIAQAAARPLPVADIARELLDIGRRTPSTGRNVRPVGGLRISDEQLAEIFECLSRAEGVDFTHYKHGSIKRRIQRRMGMHRLSYVEGYLKLLREQPTEIDALYQDILIHVTRFFREPASFDTLKELLVQRILEHPGNTLRCWVPGCATGEEVYSLAIVLREMLEGRRDDISLRIFGTDISEDAIETARHGLYPETVANEMSPERLLRWFTRSDRNYRVAQTIRDDCVFARQDITRDPAFSDLHLVLCRNLLIYLGPELQRKILGMFHCALQTDGYLVLGRAESISGQSELFEQKDKRQPVFVRRPVPSPRSDPTPGHARRRDKTSQSRRRVERNPFVLADQLLLEAYAPTAVVVTEQHRIVHTHGRTGRYLELAPGNPDLNILKMARPGVAHGLHAALIETRRTGKPARREGQRVSLDGREQEVDLAVRPLDIDGIPHYLVAFEEVAVSPPPTAEERPDGDTCAERRIRELQDALDANRDYLQSAIQDLEATNEELQSAYEEILSSNEELRSTNEELDTAKEELQSTNEELHTVNEELHARNRQLLRANSDLGNLLASVDIGIIMVSLDLRIRRFTPVAERLFNLIDGDIGRPIGHIRPNVACPDLENAITGVIERKQSIEHELRDDHGHWYSLRIRPYKNLDNDIDGAVLVLLDIDANKRHAIELQEAYRYAEALMQCIDQPLLVLDAALRVRRINPGFTALFQVTHEETEGRYVYDLGSGQWNIPELRRLLEELLPQRKQLDAFRVTHDFPQIGPRTVALSARAIENADSGIDMILLVIKDLLPVDAGRED